MARAVTVAQLVLRAKQLSDLEASDFVTATEWIDLASRHQTEVFDELVLCGPPDYYAANAVINVVAGTLTYALPANFRTMTGLFCRDSPTRKRMLTGMQDRERNAYQTAMTSGTLDLEYIPAPPVLVANGDMFDGVSGWEELISCLMARSALLKSEQDISGVQMLIVELRARIRTAGGNRDRGGPRYISDMDDETVADWWWSSAVPLSKYRLRAGNIEIYSPLIGPP